MLDDNVSLAIGEGPSCLRLTSCAVLLAGMKDTVQ